MTTPGYLALRNGAAWIDLRSRGRIIARGRDRARFLHNVTSNEVKKMTPGSVAYAFLLTPQGRIQADLWLHCREDHFLIDTEPDLREKVRTHILKYRVADQVELEDVTESTAAIGVEGPAAAGEGVPISLTGQPGFRIYCAADEFDSTVSRLGLPAATDDDARVVRIENGKPRYGEDIRETSLVQETQQLHGVSFNKGCYLGQEIVERVRAMGHVNKKLVRLLIEGDEPLPAGTKVSETGEITSSVYSPSSGKVVALAYVRTPHAEPGTVLEASGRAAVVS
jgi:tRNA-modifying protein YgfZ